MPTEPKIIGFGRTRHEQNLLDEYMLSFITRAQLEEELRRLQEKELPRNLASQPCASCGSIENILPWVENKQEVGFALCRRCIEALKQHEF